MSFLKRPLILISSLVTLAVHSQEAGTTAPSQGWRNGCVGPRTADELRTQLLKNYDKSARPNVALDIENGWSLVFPEPPAADLARVQFHVLALKSVDQKRNEYQLTAWYRRSWKDYRLAYTPSSQGGCFPDNMNGGLGVGFSEAMLNDIWKPDYYVQNLAKRLETTAGAMWLQSDGTVYLSSQVEITLACQMVFTGFPYDQQKCGIQVATYQQDAQEIRMDFLEGRDPVTLEDPSETEGLPQGGTTEWAIVGGRGYVRASSPSSLFVFTTAEITFDIKRKHQYYTDFVMVPAFMFVLIGWFSFFINRSAAPARVAMTMIGFLANMNFLSAQLGQLPKLGSNVWLLDFLTMSSVFSFYAILEYVICNYLRRIEGRLEGARKRARELKKPALASGELNDDDTDSVNVTKQDLLDTGFNMKMDLLIINPRTTRMWVKDEHVEVFSRYAYPIVYAVVFTVMAYTM